MTKETIRNQLRDIADEVMDLEFSLSQKRRERDTTMQAARAVGLSLREIGDICLVSHQTVANITEKMVQSESSVTTPPDSDHAA